MEITVNNLNLLLNNTTILTRRLLFLATSYEVNSNGKLYGADTSGSQTPLAVQYMLTAYNDAAQYTADYSECAAVSFILALISIRVL